MYVIPDNRHDSLKNLECLEKKCLGDPDNTKLAAIVREPLDKAVAKTYFRIASSRDRGKGEFSEDVNRILATPPKQWSLDQFFEIYNQPSRYFLGASPAVASFTCI